MLSEIEDLKQRLNNCVSALAALAVHPEGICYCNGHAWTSNAWNPSKTEEEHMGECREARKVLQDEGEDIGPWPGRLE